MSSCLINCYVINISIQNTKSYDDTVVLHNTLPENEWTDSTAANRIHYEHQQVQQSATKSSYK